MAAVVVLGLSAPGCAASGQDSTSAQRREAADRLDRLLQRTVAADASRVADEERIRDRAPAVVSRADIGRLRERRIEARMTTVATGDGAVAGIRSADAGSNLGRLHPAAEGETHAVDLPTVLRLAGEKAVLIEAARRAVEIADARSDLAVSTFFGKLWVGGAYDEHSGNIQDIAGAFLRTDKSKLRLAARPTLVLNPASAVFETLQARQLRAAADAGVNRAENDSLAEAAESYFHLGRTVELHKVAVAGLERATELVRMTEKGESGGVRTPADTARARALAARKELAVHDAVARFRHAAVRLALVLRLPQDVTLIPADSSIARQPLDLVPADVPVKELIDGALAVHPELTQRDREVAAAREAERAARWEAAFPRIGLDFAAGGLGRNFGSQESSLNFGVTLGWELEGMGLGYAAKNKEARARLRREEVLLEGARDRVAAAVADAWIDVRVRRRRIDAARRQFDAAKAGYDEAAKRAAAGLGLQLDVLTALEEVVAAEAELVDATADLNIAQYRLLNRIGRRPDTAR